MKLSKIQWIMLYTVQQKQSLDWEHKTCEIEIGQKVFLFRGNKVVQMTAQPKNPAIVRTLLLLHNRHTSHSGTNLQKSAKN